MGHYGAIGAPGNVFDALFNPQADIGKFLIRVIFEVLNVRNLSSEQIHILQWGFTDTKFCEHRPYYSRLVTDVYRQLR
jgi:hypothetical protein